MIAGDVVKEDGTFEIQKKISIYGLEGLKGNKLMFKMSAQQETGQARLWLKADLKSQSCTGQRLI